jgi:hypothetical protein
MPAANTEEPCPFCGRPVPTTATKCRFCGEYLDEDDDEPERRPRRRGEAVEATDFLIPTNVSGWAIASCYMGLIGFCIPFAGLLFAVPAFICGIVALRKRRKGGSYNAVTSNIRAIIGLVLSSLAILGWGGLLICMIVTTHAR